MNGSSTIENHSFYNESMHEQLAFTTYNFFFMDLLEFTHQGSLSGLSNFYAYF